MSEPRALLIEIGTEELPPKALAKLAAAFADEFKAGLDAHGVGHGEVEVYATPRRLALLLHAVAPAAPDRERERRGPALAAAFDGDGRATRAALGFARSAGVAVEELVRIETDKGVWLGLRTIEVGERTVALVPELLRTVLARLPVPRRMRWADRDVEFVRPVHWVTLLYGSELIEAEVLGVASGRVTHGHRFHHPEGLTLEQASDYRQRLLGEGYVIPEFGARRDAIREQVERAARELGGHAIIEDPLLDEITALVEWPVAVAGGFDAEFLKLPDPVLIATLRDHQRYFPVVDDAGRLLAHFITVSNIESRRPESVRAGNERVIRPRLADAAFFLDADLHTPLAERRAALAEVVFQERLGSLLEKSDRVARLAGHVAIATGASPDEVKVARRAGELCKCDLVTRMVAEFPELQGEMGAEYARRSGEAEALAEAIATHYRPRYAGDSLPASGLGRALAIADRLDTLVGIFGIGQAPTGDKDPYALRRTALGLLRILIEGELALDLPKLIDAAVEGYGDRLTGGEVADQVFAFSLDRLRGYFLDHGVPVDVYAAVLARRPTRPNDFARRIRAVDAFRRLPEAASLAAANKRIRNILKQADGEVPREVDESLFSEGAEWDLAAKLSAVGPQVRKRLQAGDYQGALQRLAGLRDAVDAFFDNVRVMDADRGVRDNRLGLLNTLSELFLATADISRLQS